MRRIAQLCLLVSVLGTAWQARAENLDDVFQRAVKAQAQGDYGAAVGAYEILIEAGVDDADVAVNLANSYGQLGRYGQAIRYFEQALKQSPRDDGARSGLARATEALGARQARERGEAIVNERPPLLGALYGGLSRDLLTIALWVCAWLAGGCALLLLLLRSASEAVRITLGIVLTAGTLGAAASWLGVGVKRDFGAPGAPAIVVVPEAELRQGPDDSAEHAGSALEGTRLRIVERRGNHVRVQLAGGSEAFAASGDIGAL